MYINNEVELDKNLKVEDLEKIKKGLTVQGKKYEVEDLSYVEGAPKKEVGLKVISPSHYPYCYWQF